MQKPRSQLTAAEITELHRALQEKLERVGIETQPEVGAKILDLVRQPDSGLQQFSRVIRTDVALSAKLLRLSNSAFFAQRSPVTNLDRACVLLGLERLRSLALGFYLSHAAASDPQAALSRQVWGQSVFRACLASELARVLLPERVSEAFVIGLMLDAGVPVMPRLLGAPASVILDRRLSPTKQIKAEFDGLPFTHVDVISALVDRWKLPELLSGPIKWHHIPPGEDQSKDAAGVLRRVAYYAGAVDLDPVTGATKEAAPLASIAGRVLDIDPESLRRAVGSATNEYGATSALFSKIAEAIPDIASLSRGVHQQLVSIIDEGVERSLTPQGTAPKPMRLTLGGQQIEFETAGDGSATLFVRGSAGDRIVSYRFWPKDETAQTLQIALGIEGASAEDSAVLSSLLESLAA